MKPLRLTPLFLLLSALAANTAQAVTYTWTGTSGTNWNTSNNWNTGVPVNDSLLNFNGSGGSLYNDISGLTLGGNFITFGASAGAYTISGNTINVDLSGGYNPAITNSSSNLQTFNNGFSVDADPNQYLRFLGGTGGFLVNGVISGKGRLQVSSGTLTIGNTANTYSGLTYIDGGILQVSSLKNGSQNSTIGSSSNAAVNLQMLYGGTLRYTGAGDSTDRLFDISGGASIDASGSGALQFTNTGANLSSGGAQTLTLTGTNTGNNTLSSILGDGSGALSLAKSGAGTWVVSGNNTYSGGTKITSGSLVIGNANALGATTGSLAVNGGTLDLRGINVTVGALSGSSGGVITTGTSGSVTLTAGGSSAVTYAGAINDGSGKVGLAYNGSGSLTLSSSNSFTGGVTLNSGTIKISNANALGSGTVNLSGGTLDYTGLGGFTQVGNSLVVKNTATFNIGSYGSMDGSVSGSGTINVNANSAQNFGNYSAFTGTLNLLSSVGKLAFGSTGMTINVSAGAGIQISTNGTALDIGALSGGAGSSLSSAGFSLSGASIGALNTNTTFAGTIQNYSVGNVLTLTKVGTGALTLTGTNTYTGATTISSGTLQIGAGGTAGSLSGSSAITNNGALVFSRSNPVVQGTDFSTAGISGSGSLIQAGSGLLTLNVANTYSGATAINLSLIHI